MPDVERLTRKLQRRKCSLADLCGLYRASSKLVGITTALQNHAGEHAQLLLSRYARDRGAYSRMWLRWRAHVTSCCWCCKDTF